MFAENSITFNPCQKLRLLSLEQVMVCVPYEVVYEPLFSALALVPGLTIRTGKMAEISPSLGDSINLTNPINFSSLLPSLFPFTPFPMPQLSLSCPNWTTSDGLLSASLTPVLCPPVTLLTSLGVPSQKRADDRAPAGLRAPEGPCVLS